MVRVCVSEVEQVFVSLPQAPALHAYVQMLVSLKLCERMPSVPQEKPEVAVHASFAGGAVSVQLLLSTVTPSPRIQVKVCVAVPAFASATQVPVRV
jgi:hypothetical protein